MKLFDKLPFPLIFILIASCLLCSAKLVAQNDTVRAIDSTTVSRNKSDSLHTAPSGNLNEWINRITPFYDKIFTTAGDTMYVTVIDQNVFEVIFNYPLNKDKKKINKKNVRQIDYANGKTEEFDGTAMPDPEPSTAVKLVAQDWEKIEVVKSTEGLENAKNLGKIESRYQGERFNTTSEYLERNAMVILKKRALRMGANLICITDKNEYRAYGELPYITINAVAYLKQ